ncbi:erythromycin esterase family protein [Flammeovirga aprica]|uniref:Erythromycin esterase family protein n=1 Tax=Flammeovirga aprica JL-4 TaxID=694437 RepID=A0A7X9S0U2_9BACT|nr:erythromycin esterase family protein [Flammeovirga aprica]NME72290.1 erythromycin esterase family protein [Flammeovirga aprica JL-4]
MKKLLILTFTLLSCKLFAQKEIKEYIRTDACEIKSMDINHQDNEDLKAIKRAIGDSRIVLLGEQDHGDAPTFLMKARLVKYLHEECGFDVIAFESNFYDLQGAFERDSLNFEDAHKGIFPIWSQCSECDPLFSYLENTLKTKNPLYISGFDMQLFFIENYRNEFRAFLKDNNLKVSNDERFFKVFDVLVKDNKAYDLDEEELSFYFKELEQLYTSYPKDDFRKQELHSLIGHSKMRTASNIRETLNIRDKYMADNLLWLSNQRFKDKKIIVWAHNFHIARNTSKKVVSLGGEVHKALGSQIYSLGFTSFSGSTGWANQTDALHNYDIEEPHRSSIENDFKALGYKQAFLDFRSYSGKKKNFSMKGLRHRVEVRDWMNILDGVIYIEEMKPCTKKEGSLETQ